MYHVSLKEEKLIKKIKERGAKIKTRDRKIAILEENLDRARAEGLEQLTAIMRTVEALEETPLDKRDGAMYLLKTVIYNHIKRLDPRQ